MGNEISDVEKGFLLVKGDGRRVHGRWEGVFFRMKGALNDLERGFSSLKGDA